MLNRLHFLWRYRQNRYAHAIATATHRSVRRYPRRKVWAMYRLNMFHSVAKLPIEPSCWRSRVAKTVSLAACGELTAAREGIATFLLHSPRAQHKIALAHGLAPFLPQAALKLIEGVPNASPAFHVALLLRNDRRQQARNQLAQCGSEVVGRYPEISLLQTNASGGVPGLQLQRLNAYLAAFGLSSLSLIDPLLAPSPLNLKTDNQPKMQSGPLISVLMTTFNTGYRAEMAISSLLAQSHQSLELIVVDDASSDDTPQRIESLTRQDSRIRLIRLPRNVGTYAAKRIGLAEARGEFVTCHDSDDWSHPEKLSRQLAPLLVDPSLVCTLSNWVRMQDDGVFYARPVYPLTRLNPSSPLFRRERVLREAGAWDCVRTGADSEFLARLKLVFGVKAVRKINQPLTIGSHRDGSLMTATGTGYPQTGISPVRQAYWESWSKWHIDMLSVGRLPYIDPSILTASIRPFTAPDALLVDISNVNECATLL